MTTAKLKAHLPTFSGFLERRKKAKRNQLLHDAQEIEYNEGGYIIWGFRTQVDAVAQKVSGLKSSVYQPLGSYNFKTVSLSS